MAAPVAGTLDPGRRTPLAGRRRLPGARARLRRRGLRARLGRARPGLARLADPRRCSAVWTAVIAVWRRRTPPGPGMLTADLAIACAPCSPRRRGRPGADRRRRGDAAGIWAASPVLGWAILRGRRGGVLAAACVAAADLVEVPPHCRRPRSTPSCCSSSPARCSAGPSSCCAPVAPTWPAPWRCRPRPASGSGWPPTSTTPCSRCSPTCGGAGCSSAARRPTSRRWRGSRRCGSARWSPRRTPRPPRTPPGPRRSSPRR